MGTAQVAEAQSGLKINSLSEVTDKAKEGADTILAVSYTHLVDFPGNLKQNGVVETLHFVDVIIIPFEPNQKMCIRDS